MATFTQLESLLRHAGMPDLADVVCVWSTENIGKVAMDRANCTDGLRAWFAEWAGCESLEELEDA